jgi:hypothetical protein
MAASDHVNGDQFPPLYHGTKAIIKEGQGIHAKGYYQEAWASDSPDSARDYGRFKIPEGEIGPLRVYKVEPTSRSLLQRFPDPLREGVYSYVTPLGFRIVGEHKFEDEEG